MKNQIFVGNLSYNTTEEALQKAFEPAGKVLAVKILKDPQTGKSRGIGFVDFSTPEEVENAIKTYNGVAIDERNVRVDHVRQRNA